MNLVLDPGGSRLKFGQATGGRLESVQILPWETLRETSGRKALLEQAPWLTELSKGASLHVLNRPDPPVAGPNWRRLFTEALPHVQLSWNTLDPLQNPGFEVGYTSGEPGSDRIAAAVACQRRDPGGSFIIIDAGTCITIDLLSPGIWRGGAILPGLQLQAAAMKQAGLPALLPDEDQVWPSCLWSRRCTGVKHCRSLGCWHCLCHKKICRSHCFRIPHP